MYFLFAVRYSIVLAFEVFQNPLTEVCFVWIEWKTFAVCYELSLYFYINFIYKLITIAIKITRDSFTAR